MRLYVAAIGQRLPQWAEAAWADYAKRLPPEVKLELRELKAEPRSLGRTAQQNKAQERLRIDAAVPKGTYRIALDEHGQQVSTVQLAQRLRQWLDQGRDAAVLIGGPDGLDDALKAQADERLRLSDLTLPHALVRVVLIEALYRAWTLSAGHPYHRE